MTTVEIGIKPEPDFNNGWLEILGELPPARRVGHNISADFVVIGAGFTGLAASRRLAELHPDARIVLIDAGRVGNNAAGRSSGFAIDQAHNIRASDFAGSVETEKQQIAINRSGQDYLRQSVTDHQIDCDWDEGGKIHAASTKRGVGKLKDYAGNLDLLNASYRWLDAGELKDITGTEFYVSGLHTPGTILVQPAALVRGLAETLPDNVTLFEHSPVTLIAYGSPHTLGTPSGRITARTVLLTNNGFAGQFGFYTQHLIPIVTWGSLTRQLRAEELERLGGAEIWGIIPADPFGTTVRKTVDRRILIRNIYGYSPGLNPTEADRAWAREQHTKSLRNRFPMAPELDFEYTWGGPLSLSRNGEPVFGTLAPEVYGAFCLNGVGIARGTAYGKLLAEHITGHDGTLLNFMHAAGRPNKLPREPFLGWGARMNFAKRRFDAGLEL